VSRRVFFCPETWKDRQFQKQFSRLRDAEQAGFLERLALLVELLEVAPHPATEPRLRQSFRAKSYSGVIPLRGAALVEYSLDSLSRVIAKFPAREGSEDILLIAVTLSHDHERLKRLIRDNRSAIDGWLDEEEQESTS
jgi:hypothetical protein